jgi:hypothetical protein
MRDNGSDVRYQALVMLEKGESEKAFPLLLWLVETFDFIADRETLALVCMTNGAYSSALREFMELHRLGTTNWRVPLHIATLYSSSPEIEMRDGAKSLEFVDEASNLHGRDNWQIKLVRSSAFAELGLFCEAVDSLDQALVTAPNAAMELIGQRRVDYEKAMPFRLSGEYMKSCVALMTTCPKCFSSVHITLEIAGVSMCIACAARANN